LKDNNVSNQIEFSLATGLGRAPELGANGPCGHQALFLWAGVLGPPFY